MNNKEFIIGKLKEGDFAKLFTSGVTPSTEEQDMFEHWDMSVQAKIDVKSLKKQNRSDLFYDENHHWIEIKNVRGKTGSLYAEEPDYFAFETINYWVVVDKLALQEFIKNNCKGKKIGSSKDPYELYRRENRLDVIVKVKTLDLFYISTKLIKKC